MARTGLLAAVVGLVAFASAQLTATNPGVAVLALAASGVLLVLLPRPLLATAALAGSFFYDDYFTARFGFWNPGKLLGIIAMAAVGNAVLRHRRALVWSPQVPVLVAFVGAIGISHTFARDPAVSVQTIVRYGLFFGLFFIVLQTVRTRRDVHRIVDVLVVAGAVAALYGLDNLFFHGWDRAGGPLADPGDFGLQLSTVVPFAVYRIRSTVGAARVAHALAAVVLVAAVLGSFSRASVVGLSVAAAWAIATGRVRLRVGLLLVAMAASIVLVAMQTRPATIESTFSQKQNIADQNVDSRFVLWEVALSEWAGAPLFGVGPGNYEVRFPEHVSPFRHPVATTHNAYLNVLAELGVAGLACFGAYLALSWRQIRSRGGTDELGEELRTAVAAAFLVAVCGAFFMTQQFYPPLWFLGAVGAVLHRGLEVDEGDPVDELVWQDA